MDSAVVKKEWCIDFFGEANVDILYSNNHNSCARIWWYVAEKKAVCIIRRKGRTDERNLNDRMNIRSNAKTFSSHSNKMKILPLICFLEFGWLSKCKHYRILISIWIWDNIKFRWPGVIDKNFWPAGALTSCRARVSLPGWISKRRFSAVCTWQVCIGVAVVDVVHYRVLDFLYAWI